MFAIAEYLRIMSFELVFISQAECLMLTLPGT